MLIPRNKREQVFLWMFGSIGEENPLYSISLFQERPVRTLCRRGEEGTDEFSDVCGHTRHTEKEDQAETSRIIASWSHFTAQNATPHMS